VSNQYSVKTHDIRALDHLALLQSNRDRDT
jgi:hypothetical protein